MSITPAAAIETFTNIASLREAAPRLAGATVDFQGGFIGTPQGGVIGDVVAFSGSQGPVLGDQLSVVGAVAGTDLLYGSDLRRFSGHSGTIRGVIELLGDMPVLTKASIQAA